MPVADLDAKAAAMHAAIERPANAGAVPVLGQPKRVLGPIFHKLLILMVGATGIEPVTPPV